MSQRSALIFCGALAAALGLISSGCASSNAHREEARNKAVQNSKMYCEFVNGDNNPDIDVAVNMAIGSKCDADRAFSLTNYRTPSEINGVLYCCGIREPKSETPKRTETETPARARVAKDVPAAIAVAPAAGDDKTKEKVVAPLVAPPATSQPVPVLVPGAAPQPAPKAPAKSEDRKPNQIIFKGDPDLDE